MLSNPTGLFLNAAYGAYRYVFVRVLHRDQPCFGRVFKLVVRAFDPAQNPAVLFKFFDDEAAMHGGYYNYRLNLRGQAKLQKWLAMRENQFELEFRLFLTFSKGAL